jgi:polyhydroxyalkanoate synthesis regulator phasin
MNETIKKGFYLGLGAGAMLKEAMERTVQEMGKRGEEMTKEGDKFGKDFMNEIQRQVDDIASKGQDELEKRLDDAGVASKKDFEKLLARITVLETRVADLESKTK